MSSISPVALLSLVSFDTNCRKGSTSRFRSHQLYLALQQGVARHFEVGADDVDRVACPPIRLDGYSIDMDEASFGHKLVEIESMSGPEPADMAEASEGVARLAISLGLSRDGESGTPTRVRLRSGPEEERLFRPGMPHPNHNKGLWSNTVPRSHPCLSHRPLSSDLAVFRRQEQT